MKQPPRNIIFDSLMDLNSNQIKTDMLLWHDMTAGKYRMMDPGGTLYDCDSNGYK
jgi:hypothetical protein